MQTVNAAIIGFGFMGKTHLYGYKTIPLFYQPSFNINLSAVYTRDLAKARQARERYGFGFAAASLDEVLADKEINVIDICTPNASHAEIILKALDAGKNIYCEKPVSSNPQETQKILAHPNLHKVITQTVFNNRFYPCTRLAKNLTEEGRLGKLLSFRARMIMPSNADPAKPLRWRNTKKEAGGGVLYDLGAHVMDMLTWLAGPVEKVYTKNQIAYATRPGADGKPVPVDTDDASYSVVTLANGAVGTAEMSKLAIGMNTDFQLELHGDKGALKLDFMDPNWLYFYDNTAPLKGFTKIETVQNYGEAEDFPPGRHPMGWIRGHADSLYRFLSCVARGVPASPSLEDGLKVQQVLDAMYASAQTGKEINL